MPEDGEEDLRERIRLLSEENEMLAERAEETLLLGLVGEKLALAGDADSTLAVILEQVAILKDLPMCLYAVREGGSLRVRKAFVLSTDRSFDGVLVPLDPGLEAALESGLPSPAPEPLPGHPARGGDEERAVVCVPRSLQSGETGWFVFGDRGRRPADRLASMSLLLHRVADMTAARLDNLYLLGELRSAAERLDGLVAERTRALREAVATLERSLAEKEVLLREVHHRVKNNMQLVSSLLDLQALDTDNEEARTLISASQGRIRAMAAIHESVYLAGDFAAVDFGEHLRRLCGQLAMGAGRPEIAISVEAEPIHLPLEEAIPCGLAANELVANCYKHAFGDGGAGRIEVAFSRDGEGRVVLLVRDDGRGPPSPAPPREGLGLNLVRVLASQLHGRADFPPAPGRGFEARFAFPPSGRGGEGAP